jgi:hypothetical protein
MDGGGRFLYIVSSSGMLPVIKARAARDHAMNQQLVVQALVMRRRHRVAALSDPERARRRGLRIRFELGKVFDEWDLLDRTAIPPNDQPPASAVVRFLPTSSNPRTDWIDYVARSSRTFQSFDTGVRSTILDGDPRALRAFGEQLLRALHPRAAFHLRFIHAFAGEWWRGDDVVFTVEAGGSQTVRCSWRMEEGGDE